MNARNTLVRSMHDVGLAAWFGGAPTDGGDHDSGLERTQLAQLDALRRDPDNNPGQ